MAKIPLRTYHREIETLIDRGQHEQAISHCRHILKIYPKHIDTYRLLGKAYLESQRYGDASDILQRVLSSMPDDFIAHAGMSIIREDEGNLEEAIWHMERAFEAQPSNATIQGELRRLYGKRDGFEPPKVRLTRGALARMYVKGELYMQAIAELRAAMAEDQQRPDLQVLLARAYFLTGQKVEAAEVCTTLLNKLPFCLEANHILAEVLSGSERAGEAQAYRQRVQALDPYAAQVSPAAPSPELVPEAAVMVEKLDWRPGQPASDVPAQPVWAASLGVNIQDTPSEKDQAPEWLTASTQTPAPEEEEEEGASPQQPFVSSPSQGSPQESGQAPPAGLQAAPAGQIPAWMKDAGWTPSSGSLEAPGSEDEEASFEDLTPAEIPDWLRPLAPEPSSPEEKKQEGQAEDFLPWLSETAPGPSDSIVTWLEEKAPETGAQAFEAGASKPEHPASPEEPASREVPDWLKGLEEQQRAEARPAQTYDDTAELPDWLSESSSQAAPASEIPDWLKDLGPEAPVAAEGLSEIPPWLSGHETPSEPAGQDSAPFDAGTPEWLNEQSQETAADGDADIGKLDSAEDEDEAFAWLESLAARQGATEGLLLSQEEQKESPPDWVIESNGEDQTASTHVTGDEAAMPDWLAPGAAVYEVPEEPQAGEMEALESEAPGWLRDLSDESEMEGAQMNDAAELPGWLQESASPGPGQETAAEPIAEASLDAAPEATGVTDWLRGLDEGQLSDEDTKPTRVRPAEMQPAPSESAEPAAGHGAQIYEAVEISEEDRTQPANLVDQDAAFAWLESLAARQGADEGLLVSPEERRDAPPDWLTETPEESTGETVESLASISMAGDESAETAGEEAAAAAAAAALAGAKEGETAAGRETLPFETSPQEEGPFDAGTVQPWLNETEQAEAELTEAELGEDLSIEAEISDESGVEDTALAAGEIGSPSEEAQVPDWLREQIEEEAWDEPEHPAGETGEVEVPELPSWLAGLEQGREPQGGQSVWTPPDEAEPGSAEAVPETAVQPAEAGPAGVHVPAPETVVDLNEAGLVELERVPGIGFIRAQAILAHREANGPFARLEDLQAVAGFDPQTIDEIKERVAVSLPHAVEEPRPVEPAAAAPAGVSEDRVDEVQITLIQARNALISGNRNESLQQYLSLIRSRALLKDVIHDLHEALYRFPIDISIWQALGDAYVRDGQLQQALDAYTKAEELLR
jgi:competence ComEA-like helix-hairpin-helix protein